MVGLEIQRVCLRVRLIHGGYFTEEFDFESRNNGFDDLILNREDVIQRAVVILRPDLRARARLHELHTNANLISCASN
jgi:hypothetical protein